MRRQYDRTKQTATVVAILFVTLPASLSPGQGDQDLAARGEPAAPSAQQGILSIAPAGASALFAVNDLGTVDAKLTRLFGRMGMPFSPFLLAKGWLEIVTGIDEGGPAGVLVIPSDSPGSTSHGLALLLPTSSREELLTFLNPQPLDNKFVKVSLRGRESYAGTTGGFTVFAADLQTAKSVVQAGKHLRDNLYDSQARKWEASDVAVWIDPAATQAAALQVGAPLFLRRLLNESHWLNRTGGIQLLVNMEPEGISLDFCTDRAGDGVGNPLRETEKSLLEGLPHEPFVLAAGVTEQGMTENARVLARGYASVLTATGILRPERTDDFAQVLELGFRHVGSAALSVSILTDDSPDGRIGFAEVLGVTTTGQMLLDQIDAVLHLLKSEPFADPRINQAMKRLQHRRAVETSLGVSVDHILLDLTDLEVVSTDAVKAVFGDEGMLIRVGLVDEGHVAIALGGGLLRFNKIVSAIREGRAPISSAAGPMRVAKGVAPLRSVEAYVSVERGVRLINTIGAVWRKPPPLPTVVDADAPIALALHSAGSAATQLDIFVPTELLIAVKNAVVDKAADEVKLGR